MGVAIATVIDGRKQFFNYGVQNVSSYNITEDTLFSINSATKVFTSVILASLVTSNKILLDERIQPRIPYYLMPIR